MGQSIGELEPWIQPYAAELLRRTAGYGTVVTSVRRTYQEQSQLYDQYLRGASRYPAAPPGRSMHERGRALDIAAPLWLLVRMGLLWEYWGGRWGGRIGDPIHFEA